MLYCSNWFVRNDKLAPCLRSWLLSSLVVCRGPWERRRRRWRRRWRSARASVQSGQSSSSNCAERATTASARRRWRQRRDRGAARVATCWTGETTGDVSCRPSSRRRRRPPTAGWRETRRIRTRPSSGLALHTVTTMKLIDSQMCTTKYAAKLIPVLKR